jgi:hypothetical protein
MVEQPLVLVEAEKQRADLLLPLRHSEPPDHAVRVRCCLTLTIARSPGRYSWVVRFGDDPVERAAAALQPASAISGRSLPGIGVGRRFVP